MKIPKQYLTLDDFGSISDSLQSFLVVGVGNNNRSNPFSTLRFKENQTGRIGIPGISIWEMEVLPILV
jgi:hypothetical protein